MILKIILFSVLRDVVGEKEIEIEIPFDDCNIDGLLKILYNKFCK